MTKKLWEVRVDFDTDSHVWKAAPIAVLADSEEEARDKVPDIIAGIWSDAKVKKVLGGRILQLEDDKAKQ